MKEGAGGLENRLQLACGSFYYKREWGLKSHSPLKETAWVHACATKKSKDAGGSQYLCPVSTRKWPSTGLTICNRLSLGCGKRGISISKPQSHLLSDKQTSPLPLPAPPSWNTSVTSWRQAGVWWVEQSAVVTGTRHVDRIITECYSNNHHCNGPHLHNIFNCQDNQMRKSTRLLSNRPDTEGLCCGPELLSWPFWASVFHL